MMTAIVKRVMYLHHGSRGWQERPAKSRDQARATSLPRDFTINTAFFAMSKPYTSPFQAGNREKMTVKLI